MIHENFLLLTTSLVTISHAGSKFLIESENRGTLSYSSRSILRNEPERHSRTTHAHRPEKLPIAGPCAPLQPVWQSLLDQLLERVPVWGGRRGLPPEPP
jgi:hypothetical protein